MSMNILSGHSEGRRVRVFVGAVVNDAIHIEVEAIEFRYSVLRNELRYSGIALAEPSAVPPISHLVGMSSEIVWSLQELRYTHGAEE